MNGTELNTLINYKTKQNDTDFTPGDKLPLVNLYMAEISSKIAETNQMFFAVPATEDLVADQREYAVSDDLLNNLIKVEIKFDADESRQPAKAIKEYYRSETESEITNNFSNAKGEFCYYVKRRALTILSGTIKAVTKGIRMWFIQYPAKLSNLTGTTDLNVDPSTTTAGFPRLFHELLARKVSMEYKSRNSLKFSKLENEYKDDLEAALNEIAHIDHNLELIGNPLPQSEQGNHGFNF